MAELEQRALSDEKRGKFLDAVKADPKIGNVAALRAAGVDGTKRDLRAMLTDDLVEDAREARGWSLIDVEQTTWDVAKNPDHPAWDRANARVLKAYHPSFQDTARLEVTGADGGPVEIVKREVSLTGVLHVLAEAGALPDGLARSLRDLADARELLPAQSD